jgi:hypothetical protein
MKSVSTFLVAVLLASGCHANPVACRAEVGHEVAATYVRDCILNSTATHPPCNEANPCWMIVKEMVRMCDQGGGDAKLCEKYRGLRTRFPEPQQ